MSEPVECAGAQAEEAQLIEAYERTIGGLQHAIALGDIARKYGNPKRAAGHLLGALEDLAPELRLLAAVLASK